MTCRVDVGFDALLRARIVRDDELPAELTKRADASTGVAPTVRLDGAGDAANELIHRFLPVSMSPQDLTDVIHLRNAERIKHLPRRNDDHVGIEQVLKRRLSLRRGVDERMKC